MCQTLPIRAAMPSSQNGANSSQTSVSLPTPFSLCLVCGRVTVWSRRTAPVISYCHGKRQQTGNLHMAKYLVLAATLLGTAACGDTWGQRAVTGGGTGAGAGALIGPPAPPAVPPRALAAAAGRARAGPAATP